MLKKCFEWSSPAGQKARLSTLIFHRVLPVPDPLFPDEIHASRFDKICGWLKSWFNVMPLDEAVARLQRGDLPARAACITFDDGYADNYSVAMPILQCHGLKATFFIATGFVDGGRMWNDSIIEAVRGAKAPMLDLSCVGLGRYRLDSIADRRDAIKQLVDQIKYRPVAERVLITEQIAELAGVKPQPDLMLTSRALKAMRHAGMQIGAHTVSHPILARLDHGQARLEIQSSKTYLEQLLDESIGLFAYPNGKPGEDYTAESVDVVRSLGFDAAVSTRWGTTGATDDLLQIRRFTPWDHAGMRFGLRMLMNLRRT